MFRVLAAVGLLSIVVAPAVAQTSASAPKSQPIASTDSSDVNKVVCKKEESLGTRLGGKKVCLTVQQWEEVAKAARDDTEAVQRGARTSPSG